MLCDKKQSLQQLIYNLYVTLHLTQLKGFVVMQFSWMLLQTYNKGNIHFEFLVIKILKIRCINITKILTLFINFFDLDKVWYK